MAEISLRAYARHRGCVHTTVRKALERGWIVALRREGGRVLLDSDDCDARWAAAQGQAEQRTEQRQRERSEASHAFANARAVREGYRARMAGLEHDVATGKLVDADDVKVAAFNRARAARDALMAIPDRVAPAIAGPQLRGDTHAAARGVRPRGRDARRREHGLKGETVARDSDRQQYRARRARLVSGAPTPTC